MKSKLIIITGGSGTGKTTLADELIKSGMVEKAITCTTRQPRIGEKDGVHYHFKTKEEIFELHKNNKLIEPPSEFSGNFYACPKSSLVSKKPVLLIVEYEGLKKIMENLKGENFDVKTVFIEPLPPYVIKERMKARGSREDEIESRIKSMKDEVEWGNFNYSLRLKTNPDLNKEKQLELFKNEIKKILEIKKPKNKKAP